MSRITISLSENEKDALKIVAEKEFREPRAQAALFIRQELERLGLLVVTKSPTSQSALGQAQGINNKHNLALKKRTHAGTREGDAHVQG